MKIRNGFVSNSSSSSFVISTSKKIAMKALDKVCPKIRPHMKEWFIDNMRTIDYNGQEWISAGGLFSSDETYGILADDNEDESLAFREINIFFDNLGPFSYFEGY